MSASGGEMAASPSATVPARPLMRSARAAWLCERVTSQVSVSVERASADCRLHHRQGNDQISEAK